MGNIHVANASSRPIRVRVSQTKVNIKEIEMAGKIAAPFSLDAKVKLSLDHTLDIAGFACIGPGESLEFDVDNMTWQSEYITVLTVDEPNPKVICYNYDPPMGRSVIITEHGTVQLSQRYGNMWKTDSGICYGPALQKTMTIQF